MQQSFNLLKEYVRESINQWNEIQAGNDTCIEIEVDEENKYITVYDSKDPMRFGSVAYLFQGIFAMGYRFLFRWSELNKRIELLIF